jgi:enoyl-CoA hydratase/carnithine racemase
MSGDLKIERHGHVTKIEFNRPDRKNMLSGAMYRAMIAAVEEADRDNSVRAIMICGSGGTFTVGDDISDFLDELQRGQRPSVYDFLKTIAVCDTPLVAAVEGLAFGTGMTMLFHFDLVYAAPGATFGMPFVDFRLVPNGAATLLASRRMGAVRAAEYLLLGETFGSKEAVRLGLANAVVPVDSLFSFTMQRATQIGNKPQQALRMTRRLLRGDREEIAARMEVEMQHFLQVANSPEARLALRSQRRAEILGFSKKKS